jgi:myo-inositol-1(or 4)-monophosphatase
MPDDPRLLATAIDVVLRAGELQQQPTRGSLNVRKKGAIDLVTEVDLAVETMFRDLIRERFPDHAILAEEFGAAPGAGEGGVAADGHRYCWIFDPLDGTTNFAHGVPLYCSSLALEIDGRVEVAAVYDPSRKELFTAERRLGAFLNGERLSVSAAGQVNESLLVTGFPYDIRTDAGEILGLFGEFIMRSRAVRRLGSAALDLCWVAAGRFEGFWEQRLHPWDIAAGALLVEEAGGRVTGMDGSRFEPRGIHILATNGRVHQEMLDVIAGYRQRQPERTA